MKFYLLLLFNLVFASVHAQITDSLIQPLPEASSKVKPHHPVIPKPVIFVTVYAGATYLCYNFFDDEVWEIAQSAQNNVASSISKNVGYLGLGGTTIGITAASGITALITHNPKWQKVTILMAGGHLINDFATHQLKVSFQRHRPNTGDGYNKFDWREGNKTNQSFVSFHTSNAFATATAFTICFPDKKWVPIVAYSAASLVGLSRIYDNAHWAADVIGGAGIGFISMTLMNKIYNCAGKRFSFLPDVSYNHYGASFVYSLK